MSAETLLNSQHLQLIDDALRRLDQIPPLLEKCERCGLDVSGPSEDARLLKESLQAIRHEFFSGAK